MPDILASDTTGMIGQSLATSGHELFVCLLFVVVVGGGVAVVVA